MGFDIISRSYSSIEDKKAQFSERAIVRALLLPIADPSTVGGSVGTNWDKILIGVRYVFNPGALNNGDPVSIGLHIGVQATDLSDNSINAVTPKHTIGAVWSGSGSTYRTDYPPNRFYRGDGINAWSAEQYIAGVRYTQGLAGSHRGHLSAAPTTVRDVILVQIEKSTRKVYVGGRLTGNINASTITDVNNDTFSTAMSAASDISDMPALIDYCGVYASSTFSVYNEATNGYFDTVYVWNSITYNIEVSDVDYKVVA